MKWWCFLFFLSTSLPALAGDWHLTNAEVSFGPTGGHVAEGGIKAPAQFNLYTFNLEASSPFLPDNYFLGLELNIFRNNSPFQAESLLLSCGFKTDLYANHWQGYSDLKLGWGLMRDKDTLYQRESYTGEVIGINFGVNYLLNSHYYLGININYLHQMHSSSWWGESGSADTVLDQFGPQFKLGYQF